MPVTIPQECHAAVIKFVTNPNGDKGKESCDLNERDKTRVDVAKKFAKFYSAAFIWDRLFDMAQINSISFERVELGVREASVVAIQDALEAQGKAGHIKDVPESVYQRFIELLTNLTRKDNSSDIRGGSCARMYGGRFLAICHANGLNKVLLDVAKARLGHILVDRANELLAEAIAPKKADSNPDPYRKVARDMSTAVRTQDATAQKSRRPPLPDAAKRAQLASQPMRELPPPAFLKGKAPGSK